MKNLTSLLAASLLFVANVSTSSAQTLTEGPLDSSPSVPSTLTDWTDTVGFAQFNPALGTLQSVTLDFSSALSTTLTVANSGTSTSSGSVKTELQVVVQDSGDNLTTPGADPVPYSLTGISQLDYLSSKYTYSLGIGDQSTSSALTGSGTSSDTYNISSLNGAAILSEFTGTGSINLTGTTFTQTNLTNTGGNTSSSQVTFGNLTGTVTYTYLPTVTAPEPSTWAMMLGGLGILVFWQTRLRRSRI